MYKDKYTRFVQTSVTNFIYCGDYYLFLKRGTHKRIDPGRLNGIGGKLEPGEDYLTAAIRETEEETGYKVLPSDLELATIGKLEGGYEEDWVMAYFKIKVSSQEIPLGLTIDDGEFLWIHKDKVLESKYELVDDLHYVFKDVIAGKDIVFFTAQVNDQEKIEKINISRLPRRNP